VSLVVGGTDTGIGVDPRAWWRVARLLRRERFDVLHVHEPLMPLVPWVVVRQAAAPIVGTFHAHREEGHHWYGPCHWLLEPLMRRIDTRIAVSEAARRTVAKDFPGEYELVPNGIDVDRFRQPSVRPADMPHSARLVLFVGRLEPRKGVEHLIQAMAIVQQGAPDARLVIVGDGPDRRALERLAGALNVAVTFSGRVSDDALPAYFRAADIVCSPARRGESFGIVLLEAMAAGRPIVATRIDGYRELLENAGAARVADVDDPAALAREVTLLLSAPELRRALGARGAVFARDYDWTTIARRLDAIYRRATARRNEKYPAGRVEQLVEEKRAR
jgi:phosphatidylinositol alpha-mannosyltransferase